MGLHFDERLCSEQLCLRIPIVWRQSATAAAALLLIFSILSINVCWSMIIPFQVEEDGLKGLLRFRRGLPELLDSQPPSQCHHWMFCSPACRQQWPPCCIAGRRHYGIVGTGSSNLPGRRSKYDLILGRLLFDQSIYRKKLALYPAK